MRWIFDGLLAAAGRTLEDTVTLRRADILARHAWRQGGRLDLFADRERSALAIEEFAGAADARGYRALCTRSEDIFRTLKNTFIADQRPGMLELTRRVGFRRLDALWRTAPWQSLWGALGRHFTDPRLRQLFARYSTYVGSSPLAETAASLGAMLHFNAPVQEILADAGRVSALRVGGESRTFDAVVFNGDASALGQGLLGSAGEAAAPAVPPAERALSAVTFCLVARVQGFPLHYHNVFFAEDYPEEFRAIFNRGEICAAPTVYVCAPDRASGETPAGPERLLLLINAPADGDLRRRDAAQLAALRARALALLEACGCRIDDSDGDCVTTDPLAFAERFPGSGGALYGRATHGMLGSFRRPGARSRLSGLYLAGGSAHPGAGVPMAAMSGRLAAAALLSDSG